MKKLRKWNYQTAEYGEYKIPEHWNVTTMETDLDKVINCAGCGRNVINSDAFTSMEIHTRFGFGYMVCAECYEKEMNRRLKWKGLRNGKKS